MTSADVAPDGLLVVGGGPAGLATARAFRESGGTGPVWIVSHDEYPPYDRPPLSKDFLRGESEADQLPLEEPSFYADQHIELLLEREVVGLHPAARAAELADGEVLRFRTCVLATGSGPATLDVPGGDHPDLFVLRSRAHGHRLQLAAQRAASAVVVGSGFIGCEAAASLAARGVDVTMVSVEQVPQEARLGREVGEQLASWLTGDGIRLVGGRSVTSISEGRTVHLDDGASWSGELVVVATGAVPQAGLAERAGLRMRGGRVEVDERMRTSAESVLAAGDIACAYNPTVGRFLAVEHWGEALRMGEIAGATAAGRRDSWDQVPGFWSEIGDRTLKYAAWGDGHDAVHVNQRDDGSFTAWYTRGGVMVGVLTHDADDDYERGEALIEEGAVYLDRR